MKKFILGMFCGALITVPISVMAASQIIASIYPCEVKIYNEGTDIKLSTQESPFLLYNNRAYVPLRLLTESVGYQVDYTAASTENNNLNQIKLYKKEDTAVNAMSIQDSESIVSIHIKEKDFLGDATNTVKISGTITINKEITGRTVDYANSFVIENELFQPLEKGQTRNFTAFMEGDNIQRYTPQIRDREWGTASIFQTDVVGLFGGSDNLDFIFMRNYPDKSRLVDMHTQPDLVMIRNKTNRPIEIVSAKIHYQIVGVAGRKETVICDYTLPGSIGTLPAGTQKTIVIPAWNFKTAEGKPISPGEYKTRLVAEEEIVYTFANEEKKNTLNLKGNAINEANEFVIIP